MMQHMKESIPAETDDTTTPWDGRVHPMELSYEDAKSLNQKQMDLFVMDRLAYIRVTGPKLQRRLGAEPGGFHPAIQHLLDKSDPKLRKLMENGGGDRSRTCCAFAEAEKDEIVAVSCAMMALEEAFMTVDRHAARKQKATRRLQRAQPYSSFLYSMRNTEKSRGPTPEERKEIHLRSQPGVLQALIHMGQVRPVAGNGHVETHTGSAIDRAIAQHAEKIRELIPPGMLVKLVPATKKPDGLRRRLRRGLSKIFRPSEALARVHTNATEIYTLYKEVQENLALQEEFPLHESDPDKIDPVSMLTARGAA